MRIVPGFGPPNAKIVIVGEAPGAQEEALGKPFVGASGNLLDEMLAEASIPRSQCYVTNVMKVRPPGNNFALFYNETTKRSPKPALEHAIEALRAEILKIRPNLIITLGAEALRALTGKRDITKWRGSLLEGPGGIKILPTFHPAFIFRVFNMRAVTVLDLKKAQKESHARTLTIPKPEFTINPTFDDVIQYLQQPFKRLVFDIETVGTFVRCVGLAPNNHSAICIPFISNRSELQSGGTTIFLPGGPSTEGSNSHWELEEESAILAHLDAVLSNPEVEIVAQNFPFDSSVLAKQFGIDCRGLFMDTMVAQHCCYSELPKSLDFLCSIYTNNPHYSDYNSQSDFETWTYNCWDCVSTFEVMERLIKELEEHGQTDFYHSHAQPLMVALTRAQNRAIAVDHDARKALTEKTTLELQDAQERIATHCGKEVNPSSPKQMKEFLYGHLKLRPILHPRTRATTTNEEALEKLQKDYPAHAATIQAFLDYRSKVKLLGTFLTSELNENGEMETSYHATGTSTGRISSSQTIFGIGGNLQQIPSQKKTGGEIRRIFVPRPGHIFIKTDLEQAEARAVAWFARIPTLIEHFGDPDFDVHKWNASLIYGKPPEQITKEERYEAKRCVHGANYGIGARKIAAINKIPFNQAERALGKYKAAIPELEKWWEEIRSTLSSSRTLITPLGRQRIFFGRLDDSTHRSAIAFLPQSTIADSIGRAFYRSDRELPLGCHPLMQVHDEIVYECKERLVAECIPYIRAILEEPIHVEGVEEPLIIPAEIKTGPNWYDQEIYKESKP